MMLWVPRLLWVLLFAAVAGDCCIAPPSPSAILPTDVGWGLMLRAAAPTALVTFSSLTFVRLVQRERASERVLNSVEHCWHQTLVGTERVIVITIDKVGSAWFFLANSRMSPIPIPLQRVFAIHLQHCYNTYLE
uniref:Putative secreted protein n=1 Tax=Anopheles marajoara TaxID=58244 RepID=A0A2M4C6V3_9DIPT